MSTPVSVLGIAGSLRKGSYNRALMHAAFEARPPEMTVSEFDLHPLPFYNGDVEAQGDPEPVHRFKEAIRRADALLIVTPEYHRSVPGVLKNALDWGARDPKGKGVITSPLSGKPVGILSASGVYGAMVAQMHLRQILMETRSHVMVQPQIFVTMVRQKFDADFKLTDDPTRQQLTDFMAALAAWTHKLK